MEPGARTINFRGIIVYGLIAVVLLAVVVGAVIWAKDQSQQYANNQTAPAGQTETPGPEAEIPPQAPATPPPADTPQNTSPSEHHEVAGSTAPQQPAVPTPTAAVTGPHQVPATGAGEWLLLTISLSLTGFMAARYVQSKRQLLASR